jgi:hypothetical protein
MRPDIGPHYFELFWTRISPTDGLRSRCSPASSSAAINRSRPSRRILAHAAASLWASVNRESSLEERERARQKVRLLQNTAFDQLVTEQLSADESFQIFITLSKDVLEQLQ